MKIAIVCSHIDHPVYLYLKRWKEQHSSSHDIELFEKVHVLPGGDILFLISCNELVSGQIRSKYKKTLVIHASDLPKGRGWSPHIWQILEGRTDITVTLIEAEDQVDSGRIWKQEVMHIEKHEVFDEINAKLFQLEMKLMDFAVDHFDSVRPVEQTDAVPSYYRKRLPENSMLDPHKSIAEQFDLLRVADPERYPAYFDFNGYRYYLVLRKQRKAEREK